MPYSTIIEQSSCTGYIDKTMELGNSMSHVGWYTATVGNRTVPHQKVVLYENNTGDGSDEITVTAEAIKSLGRQDVAKHLGTIVALESGYDVSIENLENYSAIYLGYIVDDKVYKCTNFNLQSERTTSK